MVVTTVAAGSGRFRFGENWRSYSALIGADQIAEAERSLRRLLQRDELSEIRFLDVGCGSGLFSLAARNLGASVRSFDFDQEAVECAQALKARFRPGDEAWVIEQGSILDLGYASQLGTFDVVYAWGVLHHTGDMRQAIRNAASLIAPNGLLAVALYRKTLLCPLWTIEKRWYSKASPSAQRIARSVYVAALRAKFFLSGRDFSRHVGRYVHSTRAMDFHHNVHDWMGGYPYESIAPDEMLYIAKNLSLACISSNCDRQRIGLFGSGCDEYLFQRIRKM